AYQAHIEGVIGIVFDDRLTRLRQVANLPLLTINHPMAEHGIHSISADHHHQAVLATEHLVQRGHRRIALLQIEPDEWGSRERRRGYLDVLREHGIEPDESLIHFTLQQPVYDVTTRVVRRGAAASLNFTEDATLEVIHLLSHTLGWPIVKDLSMIPLDDLPMYHYLTPPQTTIRQPLEDLARLAVEPMLQLTEALRAGSALPQTITLSIPS